MEIYKTSDTPLAAYLLTIGKDCVRKGINSHNGRIWFGFDIPADEAQAIEDEWNGNSEEDTISGDLCLEPFQCNLMFQIKSNLVRITKGGTNDPRFTTEQFKNHYLAD